MIKKGVVKDAAPRLVSAGLAGGTALAFGASKGYQWVKQAVTSRKQAIHEGSAAEQELRLLVDDADLEDAGDGKCCHPGERASDALSPEPPTSPEEEDDADRP